MAALWAAACETVLLILGHSALRRPAAAIVARLILRDMTYSVCDNVCYCVIDYSITVINVSGIFLHRYT